MGQRKPARKVQIDPAAGKRTSLKQIAALTGYSITTVSMTLNGRAEEFGIAADTRDLILAAAKERNYQPNLHARNLRSRTTNIVGLMVPTLNNRFFSEMAETFERLARRDQKLALITVTNYDRQEEIDTVNFFLSQNVQCVFTANPTGLAEVSELCSRAGTRQIFLDAQRSGKHTIATDNFGASLVLTRTLLRSMAAAGRKGRVYYVGGMADHQVTKLRLSGFRAALQEQRIRYSEDQFVESLFDAGSAYHKIELLFRNRSDIGGIFVNSLLPMDGLVRYFGEAPEVCQPVHYGVFDYHPMMNLLVDLHVAAIKQNPEQIMRKAYEIFGNPSAHPSERVQYVPYDLILTTAMKRSLTEAAPAAERGPARRSGRR